MRFGQTLRKSVYAPWEDKYIDYTKLKKLLRDTSSVRDAPVDDGEDDEWTEQDEAAFVDELVNVQLEKVAAFQAETLQRLNNETAECEKTLEPLAVAVNSESTDKAQGKKKDEGKEEAKKEDGDSEPKKQPSEAERKRILEGVLRKLDRITKETSELERYGRINYTGFLKAGKKHDRKRGYSYRVRPLLQVRLAALPFYKEDYSPLLYRLSAMYSFVRQQLDGKDRREASFSEPPPGTTTYHSYKFWVHPENLLEVKTVILRRLPVLVYKPQSSKVADGTEPDPTVTSIYFDNPKLTLYTDKVTHEPDATSLRLRWYGQLAESPEVLFEKKTIKEGDFSEEERFPIKEKYIQPFIDGEYKMEKSIARIQERQGDDAPAVKTFKNAVDHIQSFIRSHNLQPVVRANYSRTAFEIPGDDRVRISLDTNLTFIREDALDPDRPCRDPEDWHRTDVDGAQMEYPFTGIRKGEINRFPFSVLEIKIKGQKEYEWITDLMSSHLVKEAPRFSKFVHGIATLFEDSVNTFPFWLSAVETDIRKDPQTAFNEEQERKARAADDEVAVGSLFAPYPPRRASFRPTYSISPAAGSPAVKASSLARATADMTRVSSASQRSRGAAANNASAPAEDSDSDEGDPVLATGLRRLFPAFSTSRYARAHRTPLPPGISKPAFWLKDAGPVRVEAKVWLANQRTFIKWQHIGILLSGLSLGLYNAAGQAGNDVGRALAVVYTGFALFAVVWGWGVFEYRSRLIRTRSPVDFDSVLGPVVVCVGLMAALVLNFVFKYQSVMKQRQREHEQGPGNNVTSIWQAPGMQQPSLEL
ncbi:SPX-domain-containing protein [Trichodelitschia bisporula]|uniref:SPX-domain-containing protein n=1 Tax=Trichodelitschia bisporula TaxID=703511 RepID=A0A6G1HM91_9PEZI|nr:SPX-domain-containing protein [Trichodelitschia bisporula]